MGEWIICPHCKSIVPHLEYCDNCRHELPYYELRYSDNTSDKLCRTCNEIAEPNSDYCSHCDKQLKENL